MTNKKLQMKMRRNSIVDRHKSVDEKGSNLGKRGKKKRVLFDTVIVINQRSRSHVYCKESLVAT